VAEAVACAPPSPPPNQVISTSYAQQLPGLMSIADQIVALVQLRTPLAYEWYPFSATRRFPFDAGFRQDRGRGGS
jgi:hypothetical protein